MHALPPAEELTVQWFTSRLGKTRPSASLSAAKVELAVYRDRVAKIIAQGKTSTLSALNRFWQNLPTLLERDDNQPSAPTEIPAPTLDFLNIELNARQRQIFLLTEQLALSEAKVTRLQASNSFRVTAPLRSLRRSFRKLRER
ncbi:MAG: hypothetical protein WCA48_03490 [Pseudomonas gingeri]